MAEYVKGDELKDGAALVDYEEKVFKDYKAKDGEKALYMIHSVPFEGSVGIVNLMTAIRCRRKGYDVSVIFYGPGSGIPVKRGYPKVGEDAYGIGLQGYGQTVERMIDEGIKCYACRFSASALQGHRETDFIEGVKMINPLDILDCVIEHHRAGAMIFSTFTV